MNNKCGRVWRNKRRSGWMMSGNSEVGWMRNRLSLSVNGRVKVGA